MNVHAKQLYVDLVNSHETEDYRQDALWLMEVEGLSKTHLIRGVALPNLVSKQDNYEIPRLYPQRGEYAKLVFNLSNNLNIEKVIATWMSEGRSAEGVLYMLKPAAGENEEVELASAWRLVRMKPVGMQLQNFQRKNEIGVTELLVEFSFDYVTID